MNIVKVAWILRSGRAQLKNNLLKYSISLWIDDQTREYDKQYEFQQQRWQHQQGGKHSGWGFVRDTDVDKLLDMQAFVVDEKAIQDIEGDDREDVDLFEELDTKMTSSTLPKETGEHEDDDADFEEDEDEGKEVEEKMTFDQLAQLYQDMGPIETTEQASDLFESINRLQKWDIIKNTDKIWPMLYSFCKKLDRICSKMTTTQIARGLTVYARTQYCNSPNGGIANRVMIKILHRKFDQLTTNDMIETIDALGMSQCALQGISDRICKLLYKNVAEFDAQQLKTIVIAMHRMDWYEPLLFDACLEHLFPVVSELSAIDVADTMFSCAHFRHRHGQFVDAVCAHMSSEEMALMEIHPNQAGEFLRACVTLNVRDVIMGRRLLDKVAEGRRGMTTRAVISTFYSWSMLNFPYEALDEIIPRLNRRFHHKNKNLTRLEQWQEIFLGYYHFKLQKLPISYDKEMLRYVLRKWRYQFNDRRPMWLKWRHDMGMPQMERQRIHDICYTFRQLKFKAYECYISRDRLLTVDVALRIKTVRLAFQVISPAESSVNEPHIINARDVCYSNILKMKGWFVVFVPWWKWDALNTDQRRQEYLTYQLERVGKKMGVEMFTAKLKKIRKEKQNHRFRQLWE